MEYDFQFSAGQRIDDYRIEKPLYRGAMAEVYRAVDAVTKKMVALKLPSPDIINHPLVYYHYQNEMRILAGLSHPHVVRSIQRHRSTAYAVFEYIEGTDLRHQLKSKNGLSIEKSVDYCVQIAQGLRYLHDCGIIHLDIKPENILVTPQKSLKIVDFGLARHLGSPDLLYEDFAKPHGTPDYVSPEQLAHHRDDPRSDQYSLALVLYEMLTGRLPFEQSRHFSQIRRRLKVAPIQPRRLRQEIPEALQSIVLKALSVDPLARYPSMADFHQALETMTLTERINAGTPTTRTPPSTFDSGQAPAAQQCAVPLFIPAQQSILAAVTDDEYADAVAEQALQTAMTDSQPVTILTVVSSNTDDEWVRYGDEARGKRLSRLLERLSGKFSRFAIDPSVRIRSGAPPDIIIETANAIGAEVIVIGPSGNRFFSRIFGGGTVDRVKKKSSCRVVVARNARSARFPRVPNPVELNLSQIHQAEVFLTVIWIEQMDWLVQCMLALLEKSIGTGAALSVRDPMARWFQRMGAHALWTPLLRPVGDIYNEMQKTLKKMRAAAHPRDRGRLSRLYIQDALPLICHLRDKLRDVCSELRSLAGLAPAQSTGLLRRPVCPIEDRYYSGRGPIQQIQTLREYFCSSADAPREQCRGWVEKGRQQPA